MNLTVSWANPGHYLLKNPRVELDVDGAFVPATMREGKAKFVVPAGSATPPKATLIVEFTFESIVVLTVEQRFHLLPPTKSGGGGPTPVNFKVSVAGPGFFSGGDLIVPGSHPLISKNVSDLGLWNVMINTNTVDVSKVMKPPQTINPIFITLKKLKRPATESNVRLLARTDGKPPLRWVTATPPSCTAFADTGVLCFLTAPQDHPPDRDDKDFFLDPSKFSHLAKWLGTFLAEGQHDNTLGPGGRDHFAPANDPMVPPPGNAFPNFVLPRGWEAALMGSNRHVALVVPLPSGGSHNAAGTAVLPKLLADLHATLVATGVILPPSGVAVSRRPMLVLAGHSNAGAALYAAVAASPTAFKEIWLFDTNDMKEKSTLFTLASSSAAVLIAGFGEQRVIAAHEAAKKMPSLDGRIRRLPDPAPAAGASAASIAARSPKLTHALTFAGTVNAAGDWTPVSLVNPGTGKPVFDERFQVLHQQIIQGDDDNGIHFLTKALTGSAFS